MSIKKGSAPPRYDNAFKKGAVKMVTEQGRSVKETASDLCICVDTLRSCLKTSGVAAPDRVSRDNRRQRELESEIRSLRKQP